jgi:hypothetical protein
VGFVVESSFIINLWAGNSPPVLARLPDEQLQHLTVFTSRSREQGQDRFRLHAGYFNDKVAAEEAVERVRTWYPTAWVVPAGRHVPLARLRGLEPTASPIPKPDAPPAVELAVLSDIVVARTSPALVVRAPPRAAAPVRPPPDEEDLAPSAVLTLLEEVPAIKAAEKLATAVELVSINSLSAEVSDLAIAGPLELYTAAVALPSLAELTLALNSENPIETAVSPSVFQEPNTFRGDGGRVDAVPERRLDVKDWTSIAKPKVKPKAKSWLKRLTA